MQIKLMMFTLFLTGCLPLAIRCVIHLTFLYQLLDANLGILFTYRACDPPLLLLLALSIGNCLLAIRFLLLRGRSFNRDPPIDRPCQFLILRRPISSCLLRCFTATGQRPRHISVQCHRSSAWTILACKVNRCEAWGY